MCGGTCACAICCVCVFLCVGGVARICRSDVPYTSYAGALYDDSYTVYGYYHMFVDKFDYTCFQTNKVRDLAIVGLFFLLFTAVTICIIGTRDR